MQLDLFGATVSSATLEPAPPVMSAGAWMLPEGAGDTVVHDAARLVGMVKEGDVVDISYAGGRGEVVGKGKVAEVSR